MYNYISKNIIPIAQSGTFMLYVAIHLDNIEENIPQYL